VEFNNPDGTTYSPDFVALAESFGLEAHRVDDPAELENTLRSAVNSRRPVLVEVPTDRDAAGPFTPGWWDFPVPSYITDERQQEYWDVRGTEQHL
jgi:acetolactate synthase-1/2/3 large subunit